jgi:hypothetical protein
MTRNSFGSGLHENNHQNNATTNNHIPPKMLPVLYPGYALDLSLRK